MKFPTKYSHYGYGWLAKISEGFHPGIDYNNGKPYEDEGQEVLSITDGVVKYAKSNKGWGWHVIIHHPRHGAYSHYAHLQSFCVKKGEQVKEGQLVGFLGGTGGSWSPHLHFEIRLEDMSPNKYVKGMTLEEIKLCYVNPEKWIEEKIQQEQKIQRKLKTERKNKEADYLLKNQGKIEYMWQIHHFYVIFWRRFKGLFRRRK